MSDDIRTDKIVLREKVKDSLNRLMSQNYIGRTGETYHFLTDVEQDIQKDINNTVVDTASIVEKIAQMIYADIYQTKKFRHGIYDFDFDKMVDGVTTGAVTGGAFCPGGGSAVDPRRRVHFRHEASLPHSCYGCS